MEGEYPFMASEGQRHLDIFCNDLAFHSCGKAMFLTAIYIVDCLFDQWVNWGKIKLTWPLKHHPVVWHDPFMSQEECFTKGNYLEPGQSRRKATWLANTEFSHCSRKLCDIFGICDIAKAKGILKYWKECSVRTIVTFPCNYRTLWHSPYMGTRYYFYRKQRFMIL